MGRVVRDPEFINMIQMAIDDGFKYWDYPHRPGFNVGIYDNEEIEQAISFIWSDDNKDSWQWFDKSREGDVFGSIRSYLGDHYVN